jgi:ABC-type transporter MlaC component
MKRILLVLLAISTTVSAQQPSLQDLVDRAAKTTLERFADKKLQPDQLSITLINLRDAKHPVTASFRGN